MVSADRVDAKKGYDFMVFFFYLGMVFCAFVPSSGTFFRSIIVSRS